MKEPTITNEGISYEKEDLSKWFQKSQLEPITRTICSIEECIPNKLLKRMIEEYIYT